MIAEKEEQLKIPKKLPLLPVRDIVVFPFMILPLFVGRDMSIKAINKALSGDRMVLLAAQKDLEVEDPKMSDIYTTGTVALIMRMLKLPDGRVKILVQGLAKAKVLKYMQQGPFFQVEIKEVKETLIKKRTLELEALIRTVKEQIQKIVSLGKLLLPDILIVVENMDDPGRLADLVISNINVKVEDAQQILEMDDPHDRLKKVNELLNKELDLLTVQRKIQSQVKGEIDKTQREYFLRQQLKAIQKELGEVDEKTEEVNELKKSIEKAKMPAEVGKEADRQLKRLERMHPEAAEANIVRTYLELLTELPWDKRTKDNLDIKKASKVLDEDHYDLEKVKMRLLEYLGVRKLKKKMKGPVLCFVGPPGVGKTSLGKSIARALGRKFVRISLGGVRDEAEIRGHRRTYVGALPGRIIQEIHQAGSINPVFMMDEVDKIGADFRGDPAAALLEVLDPEQNFSFSDHYLGVPFNLSEVMFITTANLIDPIPSALTDRMEVIDLPGYTEEEKLKIAKQFLIPRQLSEHGITDKQLVISDQAILKIISQYTREAGLRNLEREIATICRKVARKIAEGKYKLYNVTSKNVNNYLGVRKFMRESEQEENTVGVATGLAWTQAGGEILYVEADIMRGRGVLTLTGHLGDVMKESAQAAVSYARSRAKNLGIDEKFYADTDIHIHVPAGAIPKDGPSAGITMATALISVLTQKPVSKDIAMTGELTLRGRVLPIGGLKEKALAARRAGINTIIIPKRNEKDIEDIPKEIRRKLNFIFAEKMDDVFKVALLDSVEKANTPKWSVKNQQKKKKN